MEKSTEIQDVLESIGLSKNEIVVYLDLLAHEKSSANEIAKRTSIHRTNVYDILDNLNQKSFVDKITENDKHFYYPMDPKNILEYMHQRQQQVEKILPQLENMRNHKSEIRKVYVREGLPAVKSIMTDLIEEKQDMMVYGMPKEVKEMLGPFLKEFHKTRVEQGVKLYGIYNADAMKRVKELNCMALTQARYFPSNYNSSISTLICGDKVILQFWDAPVSALVIENEAIANSYKNYFKILWDEAITVNN